MTVNLNHRMLNGMLESLAKPDGNPTRAITFYLRNLSTHNVDFFSENIRFKWFETTAVPNDQQFYTIVQILKTPTPRLLPQQTTSIVVSSTDLSHSIQNRFGFRYNNQTRWYEWSFSGKRRVFWYSNGTISYPCPTPYQSLLLDLGGRNWFKDSWGTDVVIIDFFDDRGLAPIDLTM